VLGSRFGVPGSGFGIPGSGFGFGFGFVVRVFSSRLPDNLEILEPRTSNLNLNLNLNRT
jgi:hypothetical protein